jgi:hypothetical protein
MVLKKFGFLNNFWQTVNCLTNAQSLAKQTNTKWEFPASCRLDFSPVRRANGTDIHYCARAGRSFCQKLSIGVSARQA